METGRNRPWLKFHKMRWAHEYLSAPLPDPVFPIDVTGGITDFGMMGNDVWGNCFACGERHLEMTTAKAAGIAGPGPDDTTAVTWCEQYTGVTTPPGPGADLASFLLWLFKRGLVKAFAPVDHRDKVAMQGLMQAGFGLYLGVSLTDDNEAQFSAGQPWTGGSPDPANGHCVVWSKSQSATGPHEVITYGVSYPCDDSFVTDCLVDNPDGEAFLVVTTEEQLALFTPRLLADCQSLGGTQ